MLVRMGVAGVAFVACGDEGTEPTESVVAAVTVSPAADTLVSLDETVQLSAAAHNARGTAIPGKTFTWSSSDATSAKVSAAGLVTAVANGTATITATTDGVAGSAAITVAQAITTVQVTPSAALLRSLGDSTALMASAQDANGNAIIGATFTWASSDEDVATVDASGMVKAVHNGEAMIGATLEGDTVVGTTAVTVAQEAAVVAVNPKGASVSGVDATSQFTVEAWDAGGSPIDSAVVIWSSLNPNVATVEASTGEATALEAGQVTIAASVDGAVGYALLTVAVPDAEPVNLWSEMASGGSGARWEAVWGPSPDDLWVVGTSGTRHFDGVTWSPVSEAFGMGVWGSSAADIFFVGWTGTINHYDGTEWTRMESGSGTDLYDVWGTSPTDVYAVGLAGVILHYDGTSWSKMPSGTFEDLKDIWGTSSEDVYAVGTGATILHYDGLSWSPMGSGNANVNGVWGASATDVYVVGDFANILHYDGASWSTMVTGSTMQRPLDVWGTSTTDVYAMGTSGLMIRHDGSAWRLVETGTGSQLYNAWGTSAGDVFAVGEAQVILRGVRGGSVALTPDTPARIGVGDTTRLAAEARDADGDPVDGVTYAWASTDMGVARVDATGLVTSFGIGTASIVATAPGGAADTVSITVVENPGAPVAVIDNPGQDTTVTLGDAVDFRGTATDVDGTIVSHTWDFGDGSGASVEDPGEHTYAAEGTYTVTYSVTDNDGNTSNPATLTVRADASPIVPGAWQSDVAFGTLEFTVNAPSTAITLVWFLFSGYTCGTVTVSGGIGFGGTWSIADDQFAFSSWAGSDQFQLSGTFTPEGTQASGTWQVQLSGHTCSGTWEGSPAP